MSRSLFEIVKGENHPKTLYKYRECNPRHFKMLEDGQLFFARPSDLNDPFDCKLPIYFGDMTDPEKEEYLRNGKVRIPVAELNNVLTDGWLVYTQRYGAMDRFGVCSFSSRKDSLVMWSMYSCSHSGFCVGYDKNLLQSRFNDVASDRPILFSKVKYFKDIPKHGPKSLGTRDVIGFELVRSKSIEYEYEEEIRATCSSDSHFTLNFPIEAVSEVILGCLMADEHVKTMKGLVKNRYPAAKLFKARMSTMKFGLSFDEV